MRKITANLSIFVLLISFISCTKTLGDATSSTDISSVSVSSVSGPPSNQNQPGVITAGEWNDLDNWPFWNTILSKDEFKTVPERWPFFNTNRISVKVTTIDTKPVVDALVKLKKEGTVIFSARTDNRGNAEVWPNLFVTNAALDYSKLTLDVNNGSGTISNVKPYKDGINHITISPTANKNNIEIAFIVDATGSMSDELEFLKTELLDVITRVKNDNPIATVSTSAIFYRDEGDEYVTRTSHFTSNITTTIDFIKNQRASGGGDFPEAIHSALDKGVHELQWSPDAKARLLFLLLDAPPHHNSTVIQKLQASIRTAAEKGIKVIPITASGIDKETEFLMRFFSISTNGTYVFITNHSGIGDAHLEATVGPYQVEFLNNLMVRLINQYAK